MTSTGETAAVLLKSPKDWTRWLALIKTKAVNNDIWQYIDPPCATPPAFTSPTKPLPSQFTSPTIETATAATLTAAQFQRYNAEILVWQAELKDHRKRRKVMTEIEDHVIRTAGTYWSTIESVSGLHARLVKLKARVAPTAYAREQEVIRKYEHVRNQAKTTRTEEWLAEWESALRDAIELKIPDGQGIRPTRHFLQAVEKIAPMFTQTWSNIIETKAVMTNITTTATTATAVTTQAGTESGFEKDIPDGFQIAQIFGNQFLLIKDNKGAFTGSVPQGEQPPESESTLQGEPAPSSSRSDQNQCPIHRGHTIDECFALNKNKRPEDWKWAKRIASDAIKYIEKDSKRKKKYKDILIEAK